MDNLEKLITTGKLKTYEIIGGFINVFWEHEDIPKGGLTLWRRDASTRVLARKCFPCHTGFIGSLNKKICTKE
jgi:hypothetical protein